MQVKKVAKDWETGIPRIGGFSNITTELKGGRSKEHEEKKAFDAAMEDIFSQPLIAGKIGSRSKTSVKTL